MSRRFLTAFIVEPTTSGILVTNTSGGILSVAVWDVNIVTTITKTAAGNDGSTVRLMIGSTIVTQFNTLVIPNTVEGVVPMHFNAGGQQYPLNNLDTITITQICNAGVFVRTTANIYVDMVSGS
jgi:hypothetical protein